MFPDEGSAFRAVKLSIRNTSFAHPGTGPYGVWRY